MVVQQAAIDYVWKVFGYERINWLALKTLWSW